MEKCVFLGIWGLEIHIFVVNVHFFPGRGQHLPGKCVFFPKSGNLCRVFKRYMEGTSAGYRMADRGRNVRKFQALPARSTGAERGASKAFPASPFVRGRAGGL